MQRPTSVATSLVLAWVTACGAKTGLLVGTEYDSNGGTGGSGGNASAVVDAGHSASPDGTTGPQSWCAQAFLLKPDPKDLDVTLVLDTSGSMREPTSDGETKLDALRGALAQFLFDPASAGISVNATSFPILPVACTHSVDCGTVTTCTALRRCTLGGAACQTNADCPSAGICDVLGHCEGDPSVSCLLSLGGCGASACVPKAVCSNHTDCTAASYEPKQLPSSLPAGAQSLVNAMSTHAALGGTPTLPALTGAITAAAKRVERKSVVVLATDGLPTQCDAAIPEDEHISPAGIPKVAQAAQTGLAKGVKTFVVGVFALEEASVAQSNLDAVAKAGGTEQAFIITTQQNVASRLLEALNAIRENALRCSFPLPQPGGAPLNTAGMVVRVVGGAETVALDPVSAAPLCSAQSGGYFLTGDAGSDTTRLELCPATCEWLLTDPALSVQVVPHCD